MRWLPLIASLGLLFLGIALAIAGLIFDPFSLPFQDYDSLPEATRRAYEIRSTQMGLLRGFGAGMATAGLLLSVVLTLSGWRHRPVGQ